MTFSPASRAAAIRSAAHATPMMPGSTRFSTSGQLAELVRFTYHDIGLINTLLFADADGMARREGAFVDIICCSSIIAY